MESLSLYPSPAPASSSASRSSFFSLMLKQFGTPEKVIEELVKRCNDKPIDARLDLQVFLNVRIFTLFDGGFQVV
jgi:hypothetical protein